LLISLKCEILRKIKESFMWDIISRYVVISGFILMYCLDAQAACNSSDPCAPKKVLGAWDKGISAGFNLTSGNSETKLLNLGFKAVKEETGNIWDTMAAYNFGEDANVDSEQFGDTTRNDFRASGRYDRLFSDRWFAGLGSFFLYDEIADLDYRVTAEPGLGYYFVKNDDVKFRVEAGPGYVFERQGGVDNDYIAPRISDRFEWIISCTSKLYQSASLLGDVNDSDNYLFLGEVGVESALSSSLAIVFTVRETFDNQPAPGRSKDDLQLITSLKVAL
jgi:putative salt-induced outer membrane protein YdiY